MKKRSGWITRADVLVFGFISVSVLTLVLVMKLVLYKDTYVTAELLATGGEWWWSTSPPYYWNTAPISPGDIEYDMRKKPLVEVLDVQKITQDNRQRMWIKAKIKVRKNTVTGTYHFRDSQLEIGRTITVSPNRTYIIAHVVGIEGVGAMYQEEYRIVTAKIYQLHNDLVDSFSVGDVARDNNGRITVEVLKKNVVPAERSVADWQGNLLKRKDSVSSDVTVVLRMLVQRQGDRLYFNFSNPVYPGFEAIIPLESSKLGVTILSVEEDSRQ